MYPSQQYNEGEVGNGNILPIYENESKLRLKVKIISSQNNWFDLLHISKLNFENFVNIII